MNIKKIGRLGEDFYHIECSTHLIRIVDHPSAVKKIMKYRVVLPIVLFSMFVMISHVSAQKLTAEEIIAKHLDSIATGEKRSTLKSLIASGEVRVVYVTQKNQPAMGRVVFASEGSKLFMGMNLNASDYPQERFIFDGDKASVGLVRSGSRSPLGSFIQSNSVMLSHGLFSGTLGASWALLNGTEGKAKISTAGTKKIDGRETYGLSYSPKGGSDLNITMYFDKETFRHVRTEYTRTASASMGRTMDESARQSETRFKIIEDFSDFKEFQAVTLPSKYKISYSVTGKTPTEIEWVCDISEFAVNEKLDPGTFASGE